MCGADGAGIHFFTPHIWANYIISICIPLHLADTMLPCAYKPKRTTGSKQPAEGKGDHHRRLLWNEHRMLAGGEAAVGCKEVN